MQSIIDDIYEIESDYWENISKSERCGQLTATFDGLSSGLLKTLTKEQKSLFEEICNIASEIGFEMEKTGYKAGFKSGVLIGLEVKKG